MITYLDLPVEEFSYPGGEVSVKMDRLSPSHGQKVQRAILTGADPADLIRLLTWANCVHRMGGDPLAFIPYLPAARADHSDEPVGFDAFVYANLINSGNFGAVVYVDAHSGVMPRLIERSYEVAMPPLVEAAIPADVRERLVGIIVPDKGARARAQAVGVKLGLPLFQMGKVRNYETGKLSGFEALDEIPETGDLLVVDDICDGGGTFMGLAAATGLPARRLHLWVTHGIFSGKAPASLPGAFSTIMTTDSHPGHVNIPTAKVTNLREHLVR